MGGRGTVGQILLFTNVDPGHSGVLGFCNNVKGSKKGSLGNISILTRRQYQEAITPQLPQKAQFFWHSYIQSEYILCIRSEGPTVLIPFPSTPVSHTVSDMSLNCPDCPFLESGLDPDHP